jgi:hypothetical protein
MLVLLGLMLAMAVLCSGCLSVKFYVDPQFRDATYKSVKYADNPKPVRITTEFQTNGSRGGEQQQTMLHSKVMRVLTVTRVFAEPDAASPAQAGQLQFTVNNVGDIGAAIGKGIGTGLTFGLAGSHVVDGYVMTVTYTPPGMQPISRQYKHAIHSTIGVHSAPEGMQPVPIGDAFDQVIEDMLLNFLRDLQKEGSV